MSTKIRTTYLLLFLLGALVRLINIWQPLDGNIRESWREADMASIARNYYREDMNLFYPRIDWRGEGAGFAEMEFPALPWMIALSYKVLGYNEIHGKLLSYVFSLASLLLFIRLAIYLLPRLGAAAASLFFALNPLLFRTANTLQPESLMFMLYLLASYTFIRWIDHGAWRDYLLALVATALAILAKATTVHLGLFYLFLITLHPHRNLLKRWPIWAFAILALLPALFWYIHAHTLWLHYGHSLGMSNESHWVGWDFFTNPYFISGIFKMEAYYVWMPTGFFIILFSLIANKHNRANIVSLMWLAAIFFYYFVAARTSADGWAYYYHIVSVPPIAIIFGNGVHTLNEFLDKKNLGHVLYLCGIFSCIMITLRLTDLFHFTKSISVLLWLGLTGILAIRHCSQQIKTTKFFSGQMFKKLHALIIYLLIILIPATYIYLAIRIINDIHPDGRERLQMLYSFAKEIQPLIPPGSLIICSGGNCLDRDGLPVAYNASYLFFWLDRKGFNICHEHQSIQSVRELIERGAKFYIAEKSALELKPEFEEELKKEFPLLKKCSEAYLFDLRAP